MQFAKSIDPTRVWNACLRQCSFSRRCSMVHFIHQYATDCLSSESISHTPGDRWFRNLWSDDHHECSNIRSSSTRRLDQIRFLYHHIFLLHLLHDRRAHSAINEHVHWDTSDLPHRPCFDICSSVKSLFGARIDQGNSRFTGWTAMNTSYSTERTTKRERQTEIYPVWRIQMVANERARRVRKTSRKTRKDRRTWHISRRKKTFRIDTETGETRVNRSVRSQDNPHSNSCRWTADTSSFSDGSRHVASTSAADALRRCESLTLFAITYRIIPTSLQREPTVNQPGSVWSSFAIPYCWRLTRTDVPLWLTIWCFVFADERNE